MANEKTELQKRDVKRLSNEETNKITKECILSALMVLMGEKPFAKITITEIVKRSGVSRTAFYRNFSSKEDVLSDLSSHILGEVSRIVLEAIQKDNPFQMYCQVFQLIRDNRLEFDILLKAGLQQNEYMNVSTYIDQQYAGLDVMSRYAILGWWGALQNILQDWYLHGMGEDIRDMADLCCRLLKPVARENENTP